MEDSNLVRHAEKEMRLAGLFDEDADYGGMIAPHVLDLIKLFASEGHSGASAGLTRQLFHRLSDFKTLSPITDDPEEWMDIAETSGGTALWQSRRQPSVFSTDGGKTYYDIDEENRPIHSSKEKETPPSETTN